MVYRLVQSGYHHHHLIKMQVVLTMTQLKNCSIGDLDSTFLCRYINQQLYTQTGSEAAQLFKGDKDSFHCYHEGFQNQVEKWPTNPVDIIIQQIKAG